MSEYDVIIIGGGPGGISSLLWCRRLNLRALLLDQAEEPGGQLLQIPDAIPDYAGLPVEDGRELRDRFIDHLRRLQLEWRSGCRVDSVDVENLSVTCADRTLGALALVVATGARKRRLDVPGEREFSGAGIADHALRLRAGFTGRDVCVIGGGDSAFEDAFVLAEEVCEHVTLLHRSDRFRARPAWIERVFDHPRITVIPFAEVEEFSGDTEKRRLVRLLIRDSRNGRQQSILAQGAVVQIGIEPNTEFLARQLQLDAAGYIKADQRQRTSMKMVYAVGDVTRPVCLSIATAVGHGAIAVRDIADILRQRSP